MCQVSAYPTEIFGSLMAGLTGNNPWFRNYVIYLRTYVTFGSKPTSLIFIVGGLTNNHLRNLFKNKIKTLSESAVY